jgi:hypothetical protein
MNKQHIIELLTYLSNCYSGKFKFPKPDQRNNQMLINDWHDLLKYYSVELVNKAAKKLVVNNHDWPPSVGAIVHEIELIKQPPENRITAGMAWKLVMKAVRKYGYYKPKEAMESLPPKVRATVEHFGGFAEICHTKENDSFVKNHFHKLYNEVTRYDKDLQYLPEEFRQELIYISENITERK